MYQLTKIKKAIENQLLEVYAVEKNGKVLYDFTLKREEAENIVDLLNDNGVEENHVIDVIEDLIYS